MKTLMNDRMVVSRSSLDGGGGIRIVRNLLHDIVQHHDLNLNVMDVAFDFLFH